MNNSTLDWAILVINVVFITAGVLCALTAIGGNTWENKPELPFHRRITGRGWVAIICLLLTLGFGILKEVLATAEQSALRKKLADTTTQLEVARTEVLKGQSRTDDIILQLTTAILDIQDSTVYRDHHSFRLGLMWHWLGNQQYAIYHFRQQLTSRGTHIPSQYNLGVVLAASGRTLEAKGTFNQIPVAELKPDRRALVTSWLKALDSNVLPDKSAGEWHLWRLP